MLQIPAVHTVFAQKELFAAIAGLYDIGTPASSRFISNGLNDTYRVDTERGPFILRIYKCGWRSEPDIRFELDLLLHLSEQGIPVSIPIKRRDGEALTMLEAPEGVRFAVMFTFAEGKEKNDAESSRLYGRSVAQLHHAADSYVPKHERFLLDTGHLLDEPLRHIAPFLEHRPEDWKFLQEASERMKARISSMGEECLEWGVCHGDLHGWNVFFGDDGELTHFDFDCCGMGWRAYDLAVFLWARVDSKTKAEEFKDASWDAFLEAYREERTLRAADLEAIPLFVAIRQIWLVGLHTGNSAIWGAWQDDRYFDRKLGFLRAWMEAHGL